MSGGNSQRVHRVISEVAEDLDLQQHVLRFWEKRIPQVQPLKRAGGRRYYRPEDFELLRGIRVLLHGQGYAIRGVQRLIAEQGADHVRAIGRGEIELEPSAKTENLKLGDVFPGMASLPAELRTALEIALADPVAARELAEHIIRV